MTAPEGRPVVVYLPDGERVELLPHVAVGPHYAVRIEPHLYVLAGPDPEAAWSAIGRAFDSGRPVYVDGARCLMDRLSVVEVRESSQSPAHAELVVHFTAIPLAPPPRIAMPT
jgi:hypothetical protein